MKWQNVLAGVAARFGGKAMAVRVGTLALVAALSGLVAAGLVDSAAMAEFCASL